MFAGAERHGTLDRALRFVGLGAGSVDEVPADGNGAMQAELRGRRCSPKTADAPTIVCAQAGNVNSGACDDLRAICEAARSVGAWVHVDGAFGLWAAASPSTRHLVDGIELADSWACDGHKWLNVPYDSGFAFCAHPEVHRNAMSYTAAYLTGQSLTRHVPGRPTWCSSPRVAPVGSRCGRRCSRSVVPVSRTSWTAVARSHAGSRSNSMLSTDSRS